MFHFQNEKILPIDLSDEKKMNWAFPTKLSLWTYPTLERNLLSLEQSLLSPKKIMIFWNNKGI